MAQIFSHSVFTELANASCVDRINSLISKSRYNIDLGMPILDQIEMAYSCLLENYRCEYVYKNEIANNLHLSLHDLKESILLSELSSSGNIADLIIVNGQTTAYEIKTELDNFDRLPQQISSYSSLYDRVYVVTHQNAIKRSTLSIPKNVGIISLTANLGVDIIREAKCNKRQFDPSKAVFTLRQTELVTAYKAIHGPIPTMGTGLIFEFCHNWFTSLKKESARAIFAQCLKSRRPASHQVELIEKCSRSLKMLALTLKTSKYNCLEIKKSLGIFNA